MSQEDLISFNRVTIVGPGLLGASIAMSLKKKGIAREIWVWLRNEQKKELCEQSDWCDRALIDLQDAVRNSDLVILCTPVELILNQLTQVSGWLKAGCIVTDVGSLKKGICQRADEVFRDKQIYVQDHVDGEIAHTPPDSELVEKYMEDLCEFANSEKPFIHPIIKASIIHFQIGYIHPFMDGNGRTARALFYWFLVKKEYTLIKNISISRAILNSRIQYDKAFLKTENDNNDMTYFINYQLKVYVLLSKV